MPPTDDLAAVADALAELGAVTRAIAAMRADLARSYARRDELVIQLARLGVPYGEIAEITETTERAVGKIVRAAGVRRYRQRS